MIEDKKFPSFDGLSSGLKIMVIKCLVESGKVNKNDIDDVIYDAIRLWLKENANIDTEIVNNKPANLKRDVLVLTSIFSSDLSAVIALVKYFNYNTSLLVLEYNNLICDKKNWDKFYIINNDKIEIVTIVGGG